MASVRKTRQNGRRRVFWCRIPNAIGFVSKAAGMPVLARSCYIARCQSHPTNPRSGVLAVYAAGMKAKRNGIEAVACPGATWLGAARIPAHSFSCSQTVYWGRPCVAGEALLLRVALQPWVYVGFNRHAVRFLGVWFVPRGGLLMDALDLQGWGGPGATCASWSYFVRRVNTLLKEYR